MRRSFRFSALLAGILMLACSDPNHTPTATLPPRVPGFSANPASWGTLVFRTNDDVYFWWWTDVDRRLIAIQGNFDWVKIFCQGTWISDEMSVQTVVSRRYPPDSVLAHFLAKIPEAYISIVSGVPEEMPNVCEPIASGMGRVVSTSSDVARCPPGWGSSARRGGAGPSACAEEERPQAIVWGSMAEGQLVGRDGQAYHYNGEFRATYTGGPSGNYVEHARINLQHAAQ